MKFIAVTQTTSKKSLKSGQAHSERNPTKWLLHGWGTGGRTTDHYKSPDTLAEAERYYIDTLAKAIAEAQNMDEKSRLTNRVNPIHEEVEPQWN